MRNISTLGATLLLASHSLAGSYSLVGTFELPANVSAYDTLPDGRLITFVGSDFWLQDAQNSSSWTRAGSLAPGLISPFGASFVRVSPDGAIIAIGDNNFGPGATVHTLPIASLDPIAPSATTSWLLPNTDAHWATETQLFVTGAGASGLVSTIDLSASTTRTVIENIGFSAAGVTSTATHLFAGNGFDLGGASQTGEVRAFAWADLAGAGAPLDFLSGVAVADALSAASLDVDPLGSLFVGGGDVFGGSGDFGYAAAVDADALALALAGGPIAPDSAEQRLTPASNADSYFTRYNRTTGELLVTVFDNTSFEPGATVYRYAIPAPAAGSLLAFALLGSSRRAQRSRA